MKYPLDFLFSISSVVALTLGTISILGVPSITNEARSDFLINRTRYSIDNH